MGVERDDASSADPSRRRRDHRPVAPVDAVEGPDRDRALGRLELARRARDDHARTVSGRASHRSRVRRRRARRRRSSGTGRPRAVDGSPAGPIRPPPAVELDSRQERQRLERRQDRLLVGVLDRERADRGAPERDAVPAERVGDRAHVRPARDAQLELDHAAARSGATSSSWTVERAQRHLDGDPAPVQPVGALALDLHRGGGRHGQLDLAAERLERASSSAGIVVSPRARRPRHRRSSCAARARSPSRSACRARRGTARAASPRPSRTSRSPVANGSSVPAWPALRARRSPELLDDRERRRPGRLVDQRPDARGPARRARERRAGSRGYESPTWARYSRRMKSTISSTDSLAREAGGLPVAAAAALRGRSPRRRAPPRVVRRLTRRVGPFRVGGSRISATMLGALDGAQVVDDALGERLPRAGRRRSRSRSR